LVQGYLEKIFVDRGSWVKAGDPLFKISVPDLEKQLEKEKADLAVCGPSIARDEANLAWRETIFNRLQEISKKTPDLINAEALDDAKGKYEVAKAELDLTKAKELGMRATVAKTQAMIDFATYAAPFDGVITDRWVDPGELIQPGTTKMLHLMQVDPIRVRIYVPAPDVRFVRPDSKAAVSFDEIPAVFGRSRPPPRPCRSRSICPMPIKRSGRACIRGYRWSLTRTRMRSSYRPGRS
jgi:multidrug resistance efflux pump